jgi:hypothetical protein
MFIPIPLLVIVLAIVMWADWKEYRKNGGRFW